MNTTPNPAAANTNIMPTYEELLLREAQRNAGIPTSPVFEQTPPVPRPVYQPEQTPAGFPQPQAHTHSAASAPQNPGYVTEAIMTQNEVHINTSAESVNAVTLKLDGESMKILMDSNEIFRETIVNMGIKLASQTSVYRDYFRLSSLRLTSGCTGGVSDNISPDNGLSNVPSAVIGTVTHTTNSNAAVEPKVPTTKKKPPGFGSWA